MYGVPRTHLSLEEYWEFLQVPESLGYGIRNYPGFTPVPNTCGSYWNQSQRYWLATSIDKTEQRMKADRWLGFPVRREFVILRRVQYSWPMSLGKWIRGMGIQAEASISAGEPITLSPGGIIADPIVLTVATTVTDSDDIVLYYPGQTKYVIRPESLTISGGFASITIPRIRLLKPQYFIEYTDVNLRPDYNNDTYFLTSIDIAYNYLDTTTGNNLVWTTVPCYPCAESKQSACGVVEDIRLGRVHLAAATYNANTGWQNQTMTVCYADPDMAEVSFMWGYADRYEELRNDLVRAIIAVAHNNMPQDPCFRCGIQQQYYERDTNPLEPPVNLGLGPSTWGIYEAVQIIKEFDHDRNPYHGGML